MNDDLIRVIPETDILKVHIAPYGDLTGFIPDRYRIFRIGTFFGLFEELKDPFCGSGSALQYIHDLRSLGDRLIEGTYIGDKCLNVADRKSVMYGKISAQHNTAHITDISDQVGDRHHETADKL